MGETVRSIGKGDAADWAAKIIRRHPGVTSDEEATVCLVTVVDKAQRTGNAIPVLDATIADGDVSLRPIDGTARQIRRCSLACLAAANVVVDQIGGLPDGIDFDGATNVFCAKYDLLPQPPQASQD